MQMVTGGFVAVMPPGTRDVITAGRQSPSRRRRPPADPEAQVAWIGQDRGADIADRDTPAAFMEEEAEALARSAVDGHTRARVLAAAA